jgi:hypothetical protein
MTATKATPEMGAREQRPIAVGVSSAAVPGRAFLSTSARPSATGSPPSTGTALPFRSWGLRVMFSSQRSLVFHFDLRLEIIRQPRRERQSAMVGWTRVCCLLAAAMIVVPLAPYRAIIDQALSQEFSQSERQGLALQIQSALPRTLLPEVTIETEQTLPGNTIYTRPFSVSLQGQHCHP